MIHQEHLVCGLMARFRHLCISVSSPHGREGMVNSQTGKQTEKESYDDIHQII